MSIITLDSIIIKNNPAMFTEKMVFQVTFTSICKIQIPLEWKIIYVGSATSEEYDQVLQEFEIGPFEQPSTMKFQIECLPPDYNKIPYEELLCVTALIISVSYKQKEHMRIGYFVHNQFLNEEEMDRQSYPILPILIAGTKRTIISDKPRLTVFNINSTGNQNSQNSISFTQNHLGKFHFQEESIGSHHSKSLSKKQKSKLKSKQKMLFEQQNCQDNSQQEKVEEFHDKQIQKQSTEQQEAHKLVS